MSSPEPIPEFLRQVFEFLDEGIILADAAGRALWWNVSAHQFFGEDIAPGDSYRSLQELFERGDGSAPTIVLKEGLQETVFRCKGLERVVRWWMFPGERLPLNCAWLVLLKHRDEPSVRGNSDLVVFFSLLMHNLKNPLAAIKVLAQGLQMEMAEVPGAIGTGSTFDGYLARIGQEVERIVKQLDSVKYLSRISYDNRHYYDPFLLAQSVMACVNPELERCGLTGSLQESGMSARVWGDPDEIRQSLQNLVEYLIKHARITGGELELSVQTLEEGVDYSLFWTGPPFDHDRLARLSAQSDPFRSDRMQVSVARWLIDRNQGVLTSGVTPYGVHFIRIHLGTGSFAPGGTP